MPLAIVKNERDFFTETPQESYKNLVEQTSLVLTKLYVENDITSQQRIWMLAETYVTKFHELQMAARKEKKKSTPQVINKAICGSPGYKGPSIKWLSNTKTVDKTYPELLLVTSKNLSYEHYRLMACSRVPDKQSIREWAEENRPTQPELRERIRQEVAARGSDFDPMIKPSDNWNFCPVVYGRIDEEDGHGYIPGDLYANCLFYYTKSGDVVVDPMAGSGQIFQVYEDRERWMRPTVWDLDIYGFDLTPRGIYKNRIEQNDLRQQLPIPHADYIFMDIPYLGMVNGQYSEKDEDLANMPPEMWESSMLEIVSACVNTQDVGGLCTVVSSNFRDTKTKDIILATRIVQRVFENAGYILHDVAYASRRIQQTQGIGMAVINDKARASRTMLTDISEVLTFKKI